MLARLNTAAVLSAAMLATTALSLAACGGGGGGGGAAGVASTPPPPGIPTPTPTPTPTFAAIIPAATTSQQFASKGTAYPWSLTFDYFPGDPLPIPSLADDSQLQVRFDASTGSYEVDFPADIHGWRRIELLSWANLYSTQSIGSLSDLQPKQQYSALLSWEGLSSWGVTAIGIPTPQGDVPVTGSATYNGPIFGYSSEGTFGSGDQFLTRVTGDISLAFNFGSGSLSGSISPSIHLSQTYSLGTIGFTNTVYSTGSSAFSGSFNTNLAGQNSFSGLFTGPAAQELIGNFAFPYISPVSGGAERAAGAFMGRRP